MKKTILHAKNTACFIKLVSLLNVANINYNTISDTNSLYIHYRDISQSKYIALTVLLNDLITDSSLKNWYHFYKNFNKNLFASLVTL